MSKHKYMSIKEFREFGYLVAVNVEVLHPVGLALEVTIGDDGEEKLSGVWDDREDPEGFYYGDEGPEARADVEEKLKRVRFERFFRAEKRRAAIGSVVQFPERLDYASLVEELQAVSDTQIPALLIKIVEEAEKRGVFQEGGAENVVRRVIAKMREST